MGVLTCQLFTVPPSNELERCAVRDPDHIPPGSRGDHVKRIQIALNQLSNVFLAIDGKYGPKTAAAVVAFKEAQSPPLRQPGQKIADNIVGIRTIKALDEQMKALEDTPPPVTGFISLTNIGFPAHNHDQNQSCAPFLDSDVFQGRITHFGTPIKPQRIGKMLCIGGTNEVKYLGFENCVPDPKQDPAMVNDVHGRLLSKEVPDHSASDICFRSAPIDRFMRSEIKRIAMPGCRLTYAADIATVTPLMPFLLSLGPQIDSAFVNKEPNPQDPFDLNGVAVVVFTMVNLR